jgi:hypothetical protein
MTRKWTIALAAAGVVAAALPVSPAFAQGARYRFTIDEASSIAWWQISPHLNHLWATTCPQEPNWQPGEDRGSGWAYDGSKAPKTGYAAVVDTTNVPLYPRTAGVAEPICPPAVRGEIAVADTTGWRGVSGLISIRSNTFVTGLNMRDEYARKAIFQSQSHPDIRYWVDSLGSVQPAAGDTISAVAYGRFELRNIRNPMNIPVKAWREAGTVRVVGQGKIPPTDLVERYKISKLSLGLGVGTGLWKYLHVGLDLVLRPSGSGMSAR